MKSYKQKGYNSNFPEEILTWRWGEIVPEWLSDKARVKFVDGDGNITLETNDTTTGGFEVIDSTGSSVLVKLESKNDSVCINKKEISGRVFPLSKIQLDLLYTEEKN